MPTTMMMVEDSHHCGYDYEVFMFDPDDPDFGDNCSRHLRNNKKVARKLTFKDSFLDEDLDLLDDQDITFFDSPCSLKSSMRQVDIKHSPTAFSIDNDMGLLDDLRGLHNTSENIAIDDVKNHSSCSTCGVSWNEDHVSLDCFECGGYSMERPCPICDGQCKQVWRRDITMSHSMRKAHWEGKCGLPVSEQQPYFLKNLIDINEDSLSEALEELSTSS